MPGTVRIILRCPDDGALQRPEDGASLLATIDSILEKTRYEPYELLVLANGNARVDLSFLEEPRYANRVSARVESKGSSLGRGINESVRAKEAACCVLLGGRCLVSQPDWLHRAVDALGMNPSASMVQPEVVQLSPDGVRSAATYSSVWAWPYDSPSKLAECSVLPVKSGVYEAMAGTGACTFVRPETFDRLGGFDPEISGLRALTMDYCVRAWMLGAPTLVDPQIQVHQRRDEVEDSERELPEEIHAVLRTAYKYLSPRRRDIAERSFRAHDLHVEVDQALARIRGGRWLHERVAHERARVNDDDWLFDRFLAYEERHARRE